MPASIKKTFYYGTTQNFEVGEYLVPQVTEKETLYKTILKKRHSKVRVTDNIEAARFYAQRHSDESGELPKIYIVRPDYRSMVKVSKTDYSTVNAQIIGIYCGEQKDE